MTATRWGLVATIKAPTKDILDFAAYHLDLGAAHLFIFLDAPNETAQALLAAHPKITVIQTDTDFWLTHNNRRPHKHQVRQTHNASFAYRQAGSLDWLAHVDVDEFLCPSRDLTTQLDALSESTKVARIAPCESLCAEDQPNLDPALTYCKAAPAKGANRQSVENDIYPNFGGFLKNGFISHTAGKIFVRTGLPNIRFAIHRAFENKDQPLSEAKLPQTELCHKHVQSWEKWLKIIEFRLTKGSYRAELEQSISPGSGRISRHQLITNLTENGTSDLRAFFEETCLATPQLCQRLAQNQLLRSYRLDLCAKAAKHFPSFTP